MELKTECENICDTCTGVLETLNKKVETFLVENNISKEDWFLNGKCEASNGEWKYYYKQTFVCGIRMATEINSKKLEGKIVIDMF